MPLFLLCSQLLIAQLLDNFADGDFTNNPIWLGEPENFVVTDGELQLLNANPESSNTSYLYLEAATSTDAPTTWEFFVRQEFSPSTSNFASVYLSASTPDLTGNLQGYFVKIGGISGSDDALQLVRQDGDDTEVLLTGTTGAVDGDPNMARVRVTRSASGEWALFADYSGGTNYQSEGTVVDDTYATGNFFGVYCNYTSTRAENFFFDDILIDPLFVDDVPPTLLSASAISATEINVQFDEPLDPGTANNAANYSINNGIGQPSTATLSLDDASMVTLQLGTPLANLTDYQLSASDISDQNGNVAGTQNAAFSFIEVQTAVAEDVIITEIMADPSPPVGLPEVEFLELFNRSNKVLQLEGWTISNGGTPRALPNFLLLPDEYVILTDVDSQDLFLPFGEVLGLDMFPTITNSGDELLLESAEGTLIHQVHFESSWYQDNEKDDGGWTLELIQLNGPYDCPNNWRASDDTNGGTPGQQNSLLGSVADAIAPGLVGVTVTNATELLVHFDESLNPAAANDPANYTIDPPIGINAAVLQETDEETVLLALDSPVQNDILYSLAVSGNIEDCIGNAIEDGATQIFGLSEPALPGDVIITEILADETPSVGLPNVEFVELYNRSDRFINLATWTISSGSSSGTLPSYFLLPESYVIITKLDSVAAFEEFGPAIGADGLPQITNDGTQLVLTSAEDLEINQVNFDRSWYQDNDKDDGGWTIELIQLDGPYDCPNNWRASVDDNGGTPGQPNSLLGTVADDTPPQLLNIEIVNETQLLLQFDEVLDPATTDDPANYLIDPVLSVSSAVLQQPERTVVALTLSTPIVFETLYTLTVISGTIQDCLGNTLSNDASAVLGISEPALPNEVIITEFFADPNPVVGLPGAEFVEVYNQSDRFLNLAEWSFSTNGDTSTLPPYYLQPDSYVILTELDSIALFEPFGPVIGVDGFPSISNDGSDLTLTSAEGIEINRVNFDRSWYQDNEKDDGGWTIELIQLDGPYDCPNNWRASVDSDGGTPGQPNSLLGAVADDVGPMIVELMTESEFEVLVRFNENLETATAIDIANYAIDQNIGIVDASLQEPERQLVLLTLDNPIQPGTVYNLTVSSMIEDCLGNSIFDDVTIPFGLAEPAAANDLVINEILFNPETGGDRFVELFNRSAKVINLNGLKVLDTQKETGTKETDVLQNYLVFPGDYVVITSDTEYIDFRYQVLHPSKMIQNSLPSFGDRFGNVTIRMDSITLDSFDYSEDLHFALLRDKNGVSLERLDTEAPTQNSGNWHSAASAIGFATPTYENSQFTPLNPVGSDIISIPKTTFSPDEDGFDDVLNINYAVDQTGYLANIQVFDAYGRLVKKIAENELLAAEGSFKWDGSTIETSKARIGIYVVWIELIRPDGQVEEIKETCVVAGNLGD